MPKFYHASVNIFIKPNSSWIEDRVGVGSNSSGWGLYSADIKYVRDILTDSSNPTDGIIYEIDVPDALFAKDWISYGKPIGQDIYGRLVNAAKTDPLIEFFIANSDKLFSPETSGDKVSFLAWGWGAGGENATAKEGAAALTRAGIQGYDNRLDESGEVIFYCPDSVHTRPYEGYGNFYINVVRQWKETGILPPLRPEDQIKQPAASVNICEPSHPNSFTGEVHPNSFTGEVQSSTLATVSLG